MRTKRILQLLCSFQSLLLGVSLVISECIIGMTELPTYIVSFDSSLFFVVLPILFHNCCILCAWFCFLCSLSHKSPLLFCKSSAVSAPFLLWLLKLPLLWLTYMFCSEIKFLFYFSITLQINPIKISTTSPPPTSFLLPYSPSPVLTKSKALQSPLGLRKICIQIE